MERYREHLRRAKSLKRHFQGKKKRRMHALCSFGKLPSLAQVLSREGAARASILGLQLVPETTHAGGPERWWIHVLSPTLNQVLPFGGLDRMRYNSVLNRSHHTAQEKSMKSLILDVVNSQARTFSADELVSLATDCCGHVEVSLFERFFNLTRQKARAQWGFILKRRVVIRVPTYDVHTIMVTRKAITKASMTLDKALSVRLWYVRVLSVMPLQSPPATMASRPKEVPKSPSIASRIVRAACSRREVPHTCCELARVSFIKLCPPFDIAPLCESVFTSLRSHGCNCSALFEQYPELSNRLGHVVLREPPQWHALLGSDAGALLSSNSGNGLWHSAYTLGQAHEQALHSISQCFAPTPTQVASSSAQASFSENVLSNLPDDLLQQVQIRNVQGPQRFPANTVDVARFARERLHLLCLSRAVSDKQLTRHYAVCRLQLEERSTNSTVFGGRFSVWGLCEKLAQAQAVCMLELAELARQCGIVEDSLHHQLGCKVLQEPSVFEVSRISWGTGASKQESTQFTTGTTDFFQHVKMEVG